MVWIAGIKPATYALESRVYQYFGNDFGNKAVVFPQSFVIPIDLAERVGFEPTVDLRLRLISSQVHSTTLPPLRLSMIIPSPRAQSKKVLTRVLYSSNM